MPVTTKLPEFICNNYKGVDLVQNASISYIRNLTGKDFRTLFLCIKKQSTRPPSDYSRPLKSSPKSEGEEELAGSPLKDDFKIDIINMSLEMNIELTKLWSDAEEDYHGVGADTARMIINDIYESLQTQNERFWVLCDGNDADQTVLFEVNFAPEWSDRGCVMVLEPAHIEDVKVDDLVEYHLGRIHGTQDFDTEVVSTYSLRSNVQLVMTSNFQNQTPTFCHSLAAKVILKQTLSRNESEFQAGSFWCDILTLNHIKKHILDFHSSVKSDPDYECGTDTKLRDLKEQISTLFTTVVFCNNLENNPDCVSTDLEAVINACKTRGDYTDVTDSLWNLLKCCSCYQDLKSAFNYIFHFVQTNNIVNIPTTTSHLARLIREISEHRLTNLCLKGTEPLELLLEIGLEKVEKDYEYIFAESKISSGHDLKMNNDELMKSVSIKAEGLVRKSVFHANNRQTKLETGTASRTTLLKGPREVPQDDNTEFHYSDFNENEIETKLCKLAHFHCTLEHILLLKRVYNKTDIFRAIVSQMMSDSMQFPFKLIKDRGFKPLEVELGSNSLMRLVEEKSPSMQRVTLGSGNSFKKITTTFLHSRDPIFPASVINSDETDAMDNEKPQQAFYFSYLYLNVKTKK